MQESHALVDPVPLPERPDLALAGAPETLPGLSIVLPCFDEEENVAAMAHDACVAASRVADVYEVLVVDDGSSDQTLSIARSVAARVPEVRVVAHAANRGYGGAVRSGFAAARMPWVFLTDADRQFDLGQLDGFVPSAARYDAIVGRRVHRADPLVRRAAARAWNVLVGSLFDLPVHDVDCAFKLVRRDVLQSLDLTAEGAMISTELMVRLIRAGARIEERDVLHLRRTAGRQSGLSPRVVARAFGELAVTRRALATEEPR
jgi:glycosyltransferase involved in cell wall biosynthesis